MLTRSTKQHDELRQEVFKDESMLAEYEAYKLQLDLAHQLKQVRKNKT